MAEFGVEVCDGHVRRRFAVGDTAAGVCAAMGLKKSPFFIKRHGGTPLDKMCFAGADRFVAGTYTVERDDKLREWYVWRDDAAANLPRPQKTNLQ